MSATTVVGRIGWSRPNSRRRVVMEDEDRDEQRHDEEEPVRARRTTRALSCSVKPGSRQDGLRCSLSRGCTSQRGYPSVRRPPRASALRPGNRLVGSSQMEAKIDAVGRIVVPKPLRDELGLTPGSTVDISRYGAGLQLLPRSRTARLVDEAGVLVASGETVIDDDLVFALIDAGRR
jgi:AbrB family looped-hinge helix DNA binding protein